MSFLRAGFLSVLTVTVAIADTGTAQAQASPAYAWIPVHAWVHDPVLASVALSPDGRHLVAVSLPNMNSTPNIGIWSADALAQAPTRFELVGSDGSKWKPLSAFWLNDEVIYAVGRQNLDLSVGARKIKDFRPKAFVSDMKKGKVYRFY